MTRYIRRYQLFLTPYAIQYSPSSDNNLPACKNSMPWWEPGAEKYTDEIVEIVIAAAKLETEQKDRISWSVSTEKKLHPQI